MQYEEARELRIKWGNKPCNHPTVDKEYYLGSSSGDRACTTCGFTNTKEWFETNKKSK